MIIIRYRGGLGNQMFQYAFQLAMQQRYEKVPILADVTHYRLNGEHNGFELECVFDIQLKKATDQEIRRVSPYYVPQPLYEKIPIGIKKIVAHNLQYKYYEWKKDRIKSNYYKQAYHSAYEPDVFSLDIRRDWYLDGLWQDMRYFKAQNEQLRHVFRFQNEEKYENQDRILLEEIKNSNSVGVHVRRGDFISSKFDICSGNYYKKAFRFMEEKIENPCFFFFSDDPDFVETQFAYVSPSRFIRHDIKNSILDMEMLSLCKNAIISNSTFALWGAWLGEREKGVVIAPRYSIINQGKKYELLVNEEWLQIEG